MRICPFDGCLEKLADSTFACRRHWYSLTKAERDAIWSAYNSYMANRIGMEELRERQQAILGQRGTA